MARQDIAGLLTGMPTQRPDPSMNREQWAMAFGQQQADRVGQGLRGLTGGTTAQEQAGIADLKAQERISALATSQDPAELRQAAQLLQQRGKPAEAARILAQLKADEALKVEETRYQEGLAIKKREVAATEAASLSSLLKAQTPSTSIVKGENGDYTVVEDKTGVVISRGSTLSEAQKVAKELAPFQERQAAKKVALNKIREVETTMRRAEELMGISRYSQNSSEALENPKLIGEIMPSSLPGTGSDYWAKMVENVPALDVIGGFEITKLESEIKTLKSGLALDALAVLKKLSSTGASGLGATNAMEIEMLQNELVTLDATLPSDLPRKFDIIRKHMNTLLNISNDLPVEIEWSNPKYGKYTSEFEGIRAYTLDNGKTYYNQVNNQLIPE